MTIRAQLRTHGRRIRGRFPRFAGRNEILYRTDRSGNITHYQEYDKDGDPVKRVDLTGRSHGTVPTPHVAEFERHITASGKAFLKLPKTVRPARPDEIP